MSYADDVAVAESGGDPNAQNPNSSASGPGQFIDSTWLNLIKQNRPDLAQGKSDAAILGMRSDPVLSHQMIDAYATQNAPILSKAGYEPSAANLYLAHFAGPGGATSVLGADPSASAAAILGPRVAQANPFLRNMTAGQLIAWAGRKVGGPAPGILPQAAAAPASAASPIPPAPAAAPASSQAGPSPASSQADLGQLGPEMAALASGWEEGRQLQPAPQLHAMPSNAPPSLLPTQAMRLRMAMAKLQGAPQGSPFPSPYAQRIADVIGNQQI